jgi:hypothetical protein
LEEKRKIYRTGTIIIHTTRTFMHIVAITDTRKQRQKFTSRLWKKRNKENEKGDNRHFVLDLLPYCRKGNRGAPHKPGVAEEPQSAARERDRERHISTHTRTKAYKKFDLRGRRTL